MEVITILGPRRWGKTRKLLEVAEGQQAQFVTTGARTAVPFLEAGHIPYTGAGGPLLLIDEIDYVEPVNIRGYETVIITTSNPNSVQGRVFNLPDPNP
jgi:predicted AAA+ superfamily ATPase